MSQAEIHVFIKRYSERLKSEGFTVRNIICPECVSPVINGVIPEIYAEEGDVKRIIAIKEDGYNWRSKELDKLREYARLHQAVSYWEFSVNSNGEWRLIENIM